MSHLNGIQEVRGSNPLGSTIGDSVKLSQVLFYSLRRSFSSSGGRPCSLHFSKNNCQVRKSLLAR
jgi:hypothetical protein